MVVAVAVDCQVSWVTILVSYGEGSLGRVQTSHGDEGWRVIVWGVFVSIVPMGIFHSPQVLLTLRNH